MGNNQTQIKNSQNSVHIDHHQFQNAKLVKGKLDKQYIQIGISMKSEKDFIQWQKNYRKIPKINAVLLPQSTKFENKGCCGSSGIVQIEYQNFPYVLSQQISNRAKNGSKYFKEEELWLLLYQILSTGQIFHIRKLKVGDVRPENIFLNKYAQVKVGNQFSWPYETTNYYKSLHNGELTYLAPEQTKDIKFGKMKDLNHPEVVQSFSIGLTVLDCAILENSNNVYGNNVSFNFDQLNKKIAKLHQLKYGDQFCQIVEGLCQAQNTNRLLVNQALKKLKIYQKQILTKQPFHLSGNTKLQNPEKKPKQKDPNSSISSIGGGDYNFVPGVIYQSKDDTMLSSLNNSKQAIHIKKNPNTYSIAQGDKITTYKTPVQTTIHYPPIINLPPQPMDIQYNGSQN